MKHLKPIAPSQITSENHYLFSRRKSLKSASALGLLTLGAGVGNPPSAIAQNSVQTVLAQENYLAIKSSRAGPRSALEITPWQQVASNVLYHEFGEGAEGPLKKSWAIKTDPWTVSIEGEVRRPRVFGLDELLKLAPMEERVYRHRCVGGWYMVIPWVGFSLAELIKKLEPTGNAKFVEFTSHWDESIMGNAFYKFPYVESLRLDEAMHPLTLLTFGHHGRVLPKQNGAPLRIVTPWKFAHKSPKAIVKIRLTENRPPAFFYDQYSHLYGWYRNVHPELIQGGSQRKEKRHDQWVRREDTPLLNGYAEQVASLYGSELDKLR